MKDILCALLSVAFLGTCTAEAQVVPPFYGNTAQEVALQVAEEMLSMNPSIEFGAFILCDEALCWSTDFAIGGAASITGEENLRIFPKTLPEIDQTVGYLHTHPKQINKGFNSSYLVNELNKRPSFQDYLATSFFAQEGKVNQPFNLWIVGPDEVLRSYPLPQPE